MLTSTFFDIDPQAENNTALIFPVNDSSIYPTLAGHENGFYVDLHVGPGLKRKETGIVVNPSVTELEFEWITQPVTLRVVDQFGSLIPNARIISSTIISFNAQAENNTALIFPVNDSSIYSTLAGLHANGFYVDLHVGPGLKRKETGIVINPSVTELEFEWITQPVTLRVVDQSGSLIPNSRTTTSTFISANAQAENNTDVVQISAFQSR
jgi:hypothetical protein